MPLKNGFSAVRIGYLSMTFHTGSPFAKAVSTYGLFNSSSMLARTILVSPAMPSVPRMIAGTHMCFSRSQNLPQLHGAVM